MAPVPLLEISQALSRCCFARVRRVNGGQRKGFSGMCTRKQETFALTAVFFPSGGSKVIRGIIARKEGEPGNEAR